MVEKEFLTLGQKEGLAILFFMYSVDVGPRKISDHYRLYGRSLILEKNLIFKVKRLFLSLIPQEAVF